MSVFLRFHCRLPALLPRDAPAPLRRGFRVFLGSSVALWGLDAVGAGLPWPPRVVPEVRAAAVTVAVIAALCWVGAIVVDCLDDKLVTLTCDRAERRARESRRHLQAAGSAPPR